MRSEAPKPLPFRMVSLTQTSSRMMSHSQTPMSAACAARCKRCWLCWSSPASTPVRARSQLSSYATPTKRNRNRRLIENGTGSIPRFSSSERRIATTIAPPKMMPTTLARRRLPRRQAAAAASNTKMRSRMALRWVMFVHGFFTPIGVTSMSPHASIGRSPVISRKFRFGSMLKLSTQTSTRRPQINQASQRRPAWR